MSAEATSGQHRRFMTTYHSSSKSSVTRKKLFFTVVVRADGALDVLGGELARRLSSFALLTDSAGIKTTWTASV